MFGTLLGLAILGGCIGLYLLPVVIGAMRGAPDLGTVVVIDVFLGWTFVGWVVALALALRSVSSPGPVVQVVQNTPPYLSPGQGVGGGWGGPPGPPPPRPGSPPPLVLPHIPPGPTNPAGTE